MFNNLADVKVDYVQHFCKSMRKLVNLHHLYYLPGHFKFDCHFFVKTISEPLSVKIRQNKR